MNLTTKFNPEDEVWLMQNNKAVSAPIERITLIIQRTSLGHQIVENVTLNTANLEDKRKNTFAAKDLFISKAELLASL